MREPDIVNCKVDFQEEGIYAEKKRVLKSAIGPLELWLFIQRLKFCKPSKA